VNIRWKANKHSYSLKALEFFLNKEILDLFLAKFHYKGNIYLIGNINEKTHLSHFSHYLLTNCNAHTKRI